MKIDWIEAGVLAASSIPVGVKDIEALHEQGIRAIVTLTEHPLTVQNEVNAVLFERLQITYLHVPVVDYHPPEDQQVWQVKNFIEQMQAQGQPVFIHCHAGVGRTGTMLHAYYLAKGLSLEDAKEKVRAGRRASAFLMLSDTQQAFLHNLVLNASSKPISRFPGSRFVNGSEARLRFAVETNGSVRGTLFLDDTSAGPPGVVHGGALAAIMDEAMTVAAFEAGRFGFTANLNVDFRAPVPTETTVTVTASVERIEGKKTYLVSAVTLPDGAVAAEARGLFIFNQAMDEGMRVMLKS
jgi:protein-tyrosine phosphatase/predicted thioesterase